MVYFFFVLLFILFFLFAGWITGYWIFNKKEIKKYEDILYDRDENQRSIHLNDDIAWKLMQMNSATEEDRLPSLIKPIFSDGLIQYPGQEQNNIEIYKVLDEKDAEAIANRLDVMCPVCLFSFQPYSEHDGT